MNNSPCAIEYPPDLHHQAEAIALEGFPNLTQMSPEEIDDLVHGLRVNLAERELQNQALRKACEEHARGEEEMRGLLERSPDLFVRFNRDLHIQYANPAFERVTALPEERVLNHAASELELPKDLTSRVEENVRSVFDSGQETTLEFGYTGTEGQRFYHARFIPERHKDAVLVSVLATAHDITDLKRAEEQIEFERRRLETILEMLPLAVIIAEAPDGRFSYINRRALELYGFDSTGLSFEENVARVKPKRLDGSPYPIQELPVSSALNGQSVRNKEMILERPDGSSYFIFGSASPILDAQGRPVAAVVVFEDITERKQVEETLKESEEKYRSLFVAMQEGMLLAETIYSDSGEAIDFRYLDVNPAFERIIGMKREQVVGKTARELIPNLTDELIALYARVASTGEAMRHEIYETFLNQYHENFIFSPAPGKVAVLFWNITERKKAEESLQNANDTLQVQSAMLQSAIDTSRAHLEELQSTNEALRESENRFARAFEFAAVGMALVEPDGRFRMVNRSLCDMVGYSVEELLTKTFQDITYPEDLEADLDNVHRLVAGEIQSYRMEKRYIHREGHTVWALLSVSLVRDENGLPLYFISQVLDITERKKAEEALRRYELLSTYSRDIILFLRRDDGRVLEANAAALSAYGYNREELLNLTLQNLRTPETRGLTAQQMAEADEHGILFETVHRRKDGSTFPVEVSSAGAIIGGVRTLISIIRDITDRKRIEREIEWLSRFPEENPHPVMRTSSEGRILYANQASTILLEHWQVQPGDSIPTPWQEVIREGIQTGEVQTREVVCCDRVYTVNFAPVPGKDYVNMYASDITERKLAEEALRESERRYRELFETMQEALFVGEVITDEQGQPVDWRYVEVNPSQERYMGMSREQMIGHTYREVVPHPDQGWIDMIGAVALTGNPISEERYARTRGRWLHLNAYSPRPGQAAVFFTDITERRQAEEALRERDARFTTLINNLSTGVALIDEQGCFAVVNPEFLRIFGLPESAEIFNVNSTDWSQWQVFNEEGNLLHVDEHPVRKAALTGQSVSNQVVAVKRPSDQATVWLSISVTQLLAAGGKPGQFVVTYTDITERKRAEERTRDLNEHLRRQTAQLEATNKELESFSYSISHDLRAPLRSLDGFSLALEEDYADKLDEQARDYTGRIRAAAQRMAQLIDDLLQLSRTTRAEIHYTTVNLSAQAESVVEELRLAEPERSVETVIQEGVMAEGDEILLRQVLQNLLGNAWKFSSHKEAARIEFGVKQEDGRRIYFVRDNGAGFDRQYAENLFVPFRRLHSESEFPGTGIGLSIVKRIIDRHGGKIWAEGEPGKGAAFYFTLGE